jgi:hypothetical protein
MKRDLHHDVSRQYIDHHRTDISPLIEVISYSCYPQALSFGKQIADRLYEMVVFDCSDNNTLHIIYTPVNTVNQAVTTDVEHLRKRFSDINNDVTREMCHGWNICDYSNISLNKPTHNVVICIENLIEKSLHNILRYCTEAEARKVVTRQVGVFVCNLFDVNEELRNIYVCTSQQNNLVDSRLLDCKMDIPEFNKLVNRNDIAYRHITIPLRDESNHVVNTHLVSHLWKAPHTRLWDMCK